ncbi:N-6 DNA methylase [Nocardia australiensis]|uniref:N-6 DNA methylase n=1 Tax=Nocardia australiensis TaxID=2887191 RepID=UPI001D13FDF0|nr:N-6 DNA methylase [Nocardia australiensis]
MDYLQLLLCAVFVRVRAPEQWARISDLSTEAVADQGDPTKLLDALGTIVDTVLREHGVLPGMRPAFARLRPDAAEDVAQVLRTCHGLDHGSFQAILDRFAEWGQRDSSEFFTPPGIVRLATEILLHEVTGAVHCHDPYLRFGEFLSGAASAAEGVKTSGYGRDPEQLRLAAMNIAVHGANAVDLLPGDFLASGDLSARPVRADFVMTNPPFNQKTSGKWHAPEVGWPFEAPPKKNGNFAWLQHVFASLNDGGRAAVVMPNQAGVSEDKDELAIRAAMVEDGVVECVIALPPGLFATTPVPVSLWFLTRRKKLRDSVLLIDARAAGEKKAGQRRLREQDRRAIVECYWEWFSGAAEFCPMDLGQGGIAVAASVADIRCLAYSLSPGDYRPIPGEIVGGNTVPLSTLCEIQSGPSNEIIKKLEFVDDGVPVIVPAQLEYRGIADRHKRRLPSGAAARLEKFQLRDRDILCVRTGTLGPCAIADHSNEGMLFGTGLLRLRIRDLTQLDPQYLVAFLSLPSTVAWIENKAAGTTIPSISSANLGKLLVPLPSLGEQRRLGAEVATADAGIAALRKQIQIAEEERTNLASALFARPPSSFEDANGSATGSGQRA